MSAGGTVPPPPQGPPPTQPAPPPAPYPYPYSYPAPYYPPPKKDNTLLIIVVVLIVIFVALPVAAGILYVMVSGLLTGPSTTRPVLTFGGVTMSSGNATFAIASVSSSVPYSNYKVTLQVGTGVGNPVTVAAETTYASVTVSGTTYRVYWTDLADEGNLNDGDSFRVAGNGVALGTGSYTFYLLWSADNGQIQTKSWQI